MADLTAVPDRLIAGDTYRIVLSPPEYPATAGWSLVLSIAGAEVVSITSQPSGDAHQLDLTATHSAALVAGAYRWSIRAKNGTAAHTYDGGQLTALADLATASPGEQGGYWERLLGICRTARERILAGEMREYMIDGSRVVLLTLDDVNKTETRAQRMISAAKGGSSFKRRRVVFVR